jgi:hypothetical protein
LVAHIGTDIPRRRRFLVFGGVLIAIGYTLIVSARRHILATV